MIVDATEIFPDIAIFILSVWQNPDLVCSQKYLDARYLMTMEIDEITEENTMPTNLVSKINRQFQDLII